MAEVRPLFDWLQEARQRPGMFVRAKSLAELEAQCVGWEAGLRAHGIVELGGGFNVGFRDWLRAEYGMSVAGGWARAIRVGCSTDEEAWERFFALVDEFRGLPPAAG